MRDKLEEIRTTLQNPLHIVQDSLKKRITHYYQYYKNRKSPAKYLRVIVKYLNGKGFIITAYYIGKIR